MKVAWIIIIVVVLMMIPMKAGRKDDTEAALKAVLKKYGAETAKNVERIYRKETAHFASRQYLLTFSPGMEAHAATFPYGWTSMRAMWEANPDASPNGIVTMPENTTGIAKKFISFPSVKAAMLSLALYLQKYPPGRWYSLLPEAQKRYTAELAQITPRIVNKLTT